VECSFVMGIVLLVVRFSTSPAAKDLSPKYRLVCIRRGRGPAHGGRRDSRGIVVETGRLSGESGDSSRIRIAASRSSCVSIRSSSRTSARIRLHAEPKPSGQSLRHITRALRQMLAANQEVQRRRKGMKEIEERRRTRENLNTLPSRFRPSTT